MFLAFELTYIIFSFSYIIHIFHYKTNKKKVVDTEQPF